MNLKDCTLQNVVAGTLVVSISSDYAKSGGLSHGKSRIRRSMRS